MSLVDNHCQCIIISYKNSPITPRHINRDKHDQCIAITDFFYRDTIITIITF